MESKECLWILAGPRITTIKKEDLSVSIVTSMDIWPRNTERRKKRTQGNTLNVKEWVILQRTAKRNNQ